MRRCEAQQRYRRINIVRLGKSFVDQNRAPCLHLLNFANQETGEIQIVHRHVQKESAASKQKFKARRIRIAAESAKQFDSTEVACFDFLLSARVTGIEAPHETQLYRDPSLPDYAHNARRLGEIERNRLLTKDSLPA